MDKYIGKRLDGRYEIHELIGVGGMANVYRCNDTLDDREVAIKILKDEYLNNEEFIRRFQDRKIHKIVTIEASGIAPAIMVGYIMQLPVVFVKKKKPKTMENMLSTVVHSFTKDRDYTVCISNNFLTPEDHILFIDDFLAYGNAAMGMVELAEQSGAVIEGMGFIIEKAFQDGGNLLREKGIRVESLAIIDNLDDCKITVR